jgi:Protein of unknown function (DUF1565)
MFYKIDKRIFNYLKQTTMRKLLLTSLTILCLFLNVYSQVYVSTTGMDAFGGGSQAAPFKTIKFAVQEAPAGSTINIASGTYAENDAIFVNKPLTLLKNGANPVIIDASARTLANPYMIGIVSTSNVTLDGLTLQNYIGNAAKVSGFWVRVAISPSKIVRSVTSVGRIIWRPCHQITAQLQTL